MAKKRSISFTLARNEEDIIEQFVRHNLKYIDKMYIADNLSDDGTKAILTALQSEGAPIEILDDPNPAHEQSKKTTQFYRDIAIKEDFDVIFFLDADELIEFDTSALDHPAGTIASIERHRFLFSAGSANSVHPIAGMTRRAAELESSKAAIFHVQDAAHRLRIGEGNHFVYRDGVKLEQVPIPTRIRHYPLRSVDQYVRKNTIGWLAMLAKSPDAEKAEKPIAAHWRNEYEFILSKNFEISEIDLEARLYGRSLSRLKAPPVLDPVQGIEGNKYDHLRANKSIPYLLCTAQQRYISQVWTERKEARAATLEPPMTSKSSDPAPVNMYWWDRRKNFGDLIGPWIVEMITKRPVRNVYGKAEAPTGSLATVGSLISSLEHPEMVLWGTGTICALGQGHKERLAERRPRHVAALRGWKTRKEVTDKLGWEAPKVFGDPALLLPRLHTPAPHSEAAGRIAIVPHYSQKAFFGADEFSDFHIVDVEDDAENVVSQITSSQCCISTSLHGVIVAHAYGIPWVWLRLVDQDLKAKDFKFEDFFTTIERDSVSTLQIEEQSLTADLLVRASRTAAVPRTKVDLDALLDSFPI